jgi:endonuclease/exonuclease/phosphatase family metal-dependent hydrolase
MEKRPFIQGLIQTFRQISCAGMFLAGLLLLVPGLLFPQSIPVTIDGEFGDWENASLLYESDVIESNEEAALQVVRLWGANDDNFLFLRIKLNREITLLENNPLVLLLDTDYDLATGYAPHSAGAELKWEFGTRRGMFYRNGQGHTIRFSNIRLRTAPSVSSNEFEIAIGRQSAPDNIHSLFRSDTVRVFLGNFQDDPGAFIKGTYVFDPEPVAPPEPIPLERMDDSDLRIIGFNAWDDRLFDSRLTNQYRRILTALDPDIIAFQEIWNHSAQETQNRLDELFPDSDVQWHAIKMDNGNVTVSRFPVLQSWRIMNRRRLTASLIDTREQFGTQLLLINVHFRCCASGEDDRWGEIAAIVDFLEDARQPGGRLHLDDDTPVVLVGDFNLVGSRDQLSEIKTAIRDWDGNGVNMVRARQTEKRMHYTWRNDSSTFSPGKLDYIFYTGSLLNLKNHYILQVETMSSIEREHYNLMFGDTRDASDHLPQVADFEIWHKTGAKTEIEIPLGLELHQNYPNPFNNETKIVFELPEPSHVQLVVWDILGRYVAMLANQNKAAGRHVVTWHVPMTASGVYTYTLKTDKGILNRHMLLLK